MTEPLNYAELTARLKQLACDPSSEARGESDDLLDQLICLDMSMQRGRRAMCRGAAEPSADNGSADAVPKLPEKPDTHTEDRLRML